MDDRYSIEQVKALIAKMVADADPEDKPAQAMIRKYKRLLAEELRNRRKAQS